MKMKTSPNDISNKEILKELKKLSIDVGGLKQFAVEAKEEFKKLSNKIDGIHVETMEAVYELSKHTDERFDLVDKRFDLANTRFDRLEGRVGSVESKMVTKGYLDDKISDLRSDMSQFTRRQIEKALS